LSWESFETSIFILLKIKYNKTYYLSLLFLFLSFLFQNTKVIGIKEVFNAANTKVKIVFIS